MRRYPVIFMYVACLVAAVTAISRGSIPAIEVFSLNLPGFLFAKSASEQETIHNAESAHDIEAVFELEVYEDLDYGFSMAIPTGWRRIVAVEVTAGDAVQASIVAGLQDGSSSVVGSDPALLEPGYAVGFESARQHAEDHFADYILVEILPGGLSGLFASDANQRMPAVIDGRSTWYDRLEVKQATTGPIDLDLVIYQAELSGVGYTVGLYAIGEYDSERIMAIAFEIMLQTFSIDSPPFSVS